MARVVYGTDRRLLDGDRVIADYSDDGPYGCIVVGGTQYEIQHPGRRGWRFALTAANGNTVCTYEPHLLTRGGRLRGRWTEVRLRGVALRPRTWAFSGEPGWRLRATVANATLLGEFGYRRSSAQSRYGVDLTGEPPILSPEVATQLAFGCWILVERQSQPVVSGGGGGG